MGESDALNQFEDPSLMKPTHRRKEVKEKTVESKRGEIDNINPKGERLITSIKRGEIDNINPKGERLIT